MSQPTDGPVTRRMSARLAGRSPAASGLPVSPSRRSSRLARNSSTETVEDKPSSQKSDAAKRLSFTDVAERKKSINDNKKPAESSDDEEVVIIKSPLFSPTRRSSRLARYNSSETLVDSSSQKPNSAKRLSFADVLENESPKNVKSPSNSKPAHTESPKIVESSDDEEEPSEKLNTSKNRSFTSPAQKQSPKNVESSSNSKSVHSESPKIVVESSDDEEEPSETLNTFKNRSFTSPAQKQSPKNVKSPSDAKPIHTESPKIVVESSDEEEQNMSENRSLNFFGRLISAGNGSSKNSETPEAKNPSNLQSVDDTHPSKITESSDDEVVIIKSPLFSPTRRSSRLARNSLTEILEEKSQKPDSAKRLSLADVVENHSPKNVKSPSNAKSVHTESPKIVVESSDEEKQAQNITENRSFNSSAGNQSSKKLKTPKAKIPSDVKSVDDTQPSKLTESSDEEVVIIKSPLFSPTRRSSRLARNSSSETFVDNSSQKPDSAKRLSFADVSENQSLKNVKSPSNSKPVHTESPKIVESSDEEEEPSETSKNCSFTSFLQNQSPKNVKSPSDAKPPVHTEFPKIVESSDDEEEPSEKLNASKNRSFTSPAQKQSPKNVKNPSISVPSESPKIVESSGDVEEPSEKLNTSKNRSFTSLQNQSPKNVKSPSDAKPPVHTESSKIVESSDDEEEPSEKLNTSKNRSITSPAQKESPLNVKSPSNSKLVYNESPKIVVESSDEEEEPVEKFNSSKNLMGSSDEEICKKSNSFVNCSFTDIDYFPVENAASFFKNRGKNSAKMLKSLCQSYSALNSLSFVDGSVVSDELMVKESDNELIWQQISMQNKAVFKEVKKTIKLFGDVLKVPEENVSDDSEIEEEADDDQMEDQEYENEIEEVNEPPRKKKKGVDLFNIRPQDLKNLDSKLKALDNDDDEDDDEAEDEEMDDEEEEEEEIVAPPPKKAKKSAVDDKFFSLSEMEKFLNEQEANGQMSDIDDDDNDDEDFETDYRYKDFFEESAPKKKNDKKVRFQVADVEDEDEMDDEEEMEEYEDEDNDDEEDETAPVLLGTKEEISKPSSSHEMSREKMLKLIDKIQSENLNPRSWELSGEVKSDDREVNSLLQKYVEADFRKKQPPINSKEKSDKIYSICLQRFKDKLFDDVTRKYRDDDTVQAYRNLTVDMNERKTLMDVYEDKYAAAQNGETESTEDIDPQVKDIQKNMNELFYKLDALSHLQFAPARISEEIRMVKNMPSMRAEEVGPMASAAADETLLAPEEITRHVKNAPKSKDERTTTDKNQERRKKKRKQSDMAKAGKMPKVGKDKEEAASASSSSKSSKKGKGKDFFAELQNVAAREVKEKKEKSEGALKKRKKPKDKSETAAKYKA
uniref:Uncharacterized protein n=1 Tax=Panagrolaimus sp. ES5 TaxID=591445 RepID=A0AC34GTN3_9BILA